MPFIAIKSPLDRDKNTLDRDTKALWVGQSRAASPALLARAQGLPRRFNMWPRLQTNVYGHPVEL